MFLLTSQKMDGDLDRRKMFYGAPADVFKKSSWLRLHETEPEKRLWQRLNKSQLNGFRFKRQHPIGYYITDFYCHKAKLVIEIDGGSHNAFEQKLHDELRTEELRARGLSVIRFTNKEVLEHLDEVVKRIVSRLPV
jgi:very-short-patch-repair endonuclease